MMKRIKVFSNGVLTHQADTTQFPSEAEFETWLTRAKAVKGWGSPGGPQLVEEDITAEVNAAAAAKASRNQKRAGLPAKLAAASTLPQMKAVLDDLLSLTNLTLEP